MYRRRTPIRKNYAKRKPFAKQIEVIQFGPTDISTAQYVNIIYEQADSVAGKTTFARPKITLNVQATTANLVYWALVFIPDGYSENVLQVVDGANLYEPAQYIMAAGSFIADTDAEPFRLTSPLKRSMNPGDKISLLMKSAATSTLQCAGTVEYFVRN
jgi:hypothetical protein